MVLRAWYFLAGSLFLFLLKVPALAQDTLRTSHLQTESTLHFTQNSFTETTQVPPSTARYLPGWAAEGPHRLAHYWLLNDTDAPYTLYLRAGTSDPLYASSVDLLRMKAGVNLAVVLSLPGQVPLRNGPGVPASQRAYPPDLQAIALTLAPRQAIRAEVLLPGTSIKPLDTQLRWFSAEGYLAFGQAYRTATQPSLYISLGFLGCLLVMTLFMLLVYFQSRAVNFLYYAGYLFFVFGFVLIADYPLKYHRLFIWEFPVYGLNLKETFVYGYLISYQLFIMHFLDLRYTEPTVFRTLRVVNYLFFGFVLINVGVLSLGLPLGQQHLLFQANSYVLYLLLPLYGYIIWRLGALRHQQYYGYIFWGTLCLYLGNLAGTLTELMDYRLPGLFPNTYTQLGTFVEVIFFSLGLGRQMLLESEEKTNVQQAYILELKRNKQLIQEANRELEQKVAERTQEVVLKTQQLEQEKQQKLEAQYKQELAQIQMMAFQAQMNPHFTFNCLSAIRLLILQDKKEAASDYIGKFARLMRLTLENSQKRFVALKQNMEYLSMYVEMERLRFGRDFRFTIHYEGEEADEDLQIPPMLLQPFVENAIWHGLLDKEGDKYLQITFCQRHDHLLCEVEDNGIGYHESRRRKKSTHQSKGMSITKEYFRLWDQHTQLKTAFEVLDKAEQQAGQTGTLIRISLPLVL
ncbi:hypothetical protein GCM10027275_34150 [Rhabdobacter roseus]|uniref:Histidine kinase n=1 Tax=Rhabdobacter roseus TaxID=1655419 RepID=A0A840TVS7_9BACT|nr:histidine kinase [Rhabdobacter roseus]MBB5285363.1 hypothetical protein [Rhabdobacter roseus]